MMLVYTSKRQISFIIAAKSYKRPVIGFFAKALGAIPVERPQDLAKKGKGKIVSLSKDGFVKGVGTDFTNSIKKSETIVIKQVKIVILDK